MRFLSSLLVVLTLSLSLISCSKKPIEEASQAVLTDIMVGTWKVEVLKLRQEIGVDYKTYNSTLTEGDVRITGDSVYLDIFYTYKNPLLPDSINTVADTERLIGNYEIVSEDNFLVKDATRNGQIVTCSTLNRESNAMILKYEFKSFDPILNFRTRDEYTFILKK